MRKLVLKMSISPDGFVCGPAAGKRRIVREHSSVPFYMEGGSLRPAFDLWP